MGCFEENSRERSYTKKAGAELIKERNKKKRNSFRRCTWDRRKEKEIG
jgi:hypothetical protein